MFDDLLAGLKIPDAVSGLQGKDRDAFEYIVREVNDVGLRWYNADNTICFGIFKSGGKNATPRLGRVFVRRGEVLIGAPIKETQINIFQNNYDYLFKKYNGRRDGSYRRLLFSLRDYASLIKNERFLWELKINTSGIVESLQKPQDVIADQVASKDPFVFSACHVMVIAEPVEFVSQEKLMEMNRRERSLQCTLYNQLAKKYGSRCVSTENDTGYRTKIDVVVKDGEFYDFYEIKVADSLKLCIRLATSQLLEYAYWRVNTNLVRHLYIVSEYEIDADAEKYLEFLRERFDLPIYYRQVNFEPVRRKSRQ